MSDNQNQVATAGAQSQGRPIREIRALAEAARARFNDFVSLWDDLTDGQQAEIALLARGMARENDAKEAREV